MTICGIHIVQVADLSAPTDPLSSVRSRAIRAQPSSAYITSIRHFIQATEQRNRDPNDGINKDQYSDSRVSLA